MYLFMSVAFYTALPEEILLHVWDSAILITEPLVIRMAILAMSNYIEAAE